MFLSQLSLPSIALVLTSNCAYHPGFRTLVNLDANLNNLATAPPDLMTTIDERGSEPVASDAQVPEDELAASSVQYNPETGLDANIDEGLQPVPNNHGLSSGTTLGFKHNLSFPKPFLKNLLPVKTAERFLRKFMTRP